MKNKILLSLLLLSQVFFVASAQDAGTTTATEKSEKSFTQKLMTNVSIGANVGTLICFADIRQYDWYPVFKNKNEWGPAASLQLNKGISPAFSLQGQLLMGGLRGTRRDLNIYSRGNTMEMTLNGIIHLSNLILSKKGGEKKWSYYFTIGVGLTSFRSQVYYLNSDLPVIGGVAALSQGYAYNTTTGELEKAARTTETVIPYGIGIKYKLSPSLQLGFEMTSRLTNTDKLDGYNYVGSAKDFYTYTALGLTYKFAKDATKEDAEWNNPLEDMYTELMKGQEKLEGLTSDADADGVADIFDKEANTPKGVAVDGSGKSLDIDEDGVADYMDADRFTPKGAKVDANGRELDADGDGVPDSRDLEPNTKKGTLVNFQGVSINAAPSTTSTVNTSASTGYLPSIFFKVNSSSVDYSNYERLATIAQVMKTNANVKLNVIGNADKSGSESYNLEISKRRAQAVVDHLVKIYGISASRLNVVAKGSQAPLASGDPKAEVNRRVDFEISK